MEDIIEKFLERQKAVLDSGDKGEIARVFYGYKGALGIQAAAFNQYLGEQSGTLASAQIATKAVINEIYRRMGDLAKDLQACDIPDAVRPQVTQAYLSMATSRYLQERVDLSKLQEFAQANNNVLKVASQFIKGESLEECRVFMLDVIRKPKSKPSKTIGTIAPGAGGLLARISRMMWTKEEQEVEIKKVDATVSEAKKITDVIRELVQNTNTLAHAFILCDELIEKGDSQQNLIAVSIIMKQVHESEDFGLIDLRRIADYLKKVLWQHRDLTDHIKVNIDVVLEKAKKACLGGALKEIEGRELAKIEEMKKEIYRPVPQSVFRKQ